MGVITFSDKVAFDGYRNDNMSSPGIVSYSGTYTNDGLGLIPSSGLFITPKIGLYAFHFRAVTNDGTGTYVKLMHNEIQVAATYRMSPKVRIHIEYIKIIHQLLQLPWQKMAFKVGREFSARFQ